MVCNLFFNYILKLDIHKIMEYNLLVIGFMGNRMANVIEFNFNFLQLQ